MAGFSFLLFVSLVFFTYFYVYECLSACMYVSHMCAWYAWRSEEGIRASGDTGGCELPHV